MASIEAKLNRGSEHSFNDLKNFWQKRSDSPSNHINGSVNVLFECDDKQVNSTVGAYEEKKEKKLALVSSLITDSQESKEASKNGNRRITMNRHRRISTVKAKGTGLTCERGMNYRWRPNLEEIDGFCGASSSSEYRVHSANSFEINKKKQKEEVFQDMLEAFELSQGYSPSSQIQGIPDDLKQLMLMRLPEMKSFYEKNSSNVGEDCYQQDVLDIGGKVCSTPDGASLQYETSIVQGDVDFDILPTDETSKMTVGEDDYLSQSLSTRSTCIVEQEKDDEVGLTKALLTEDPTVVVVDTAGSSEGALHDSIQIIQTSLLEPPGPNSQQQQQSEDDDGIFLFDRHHNHSVGASNVRYDVVPVNEVIESSTIDSPICTASSVTLSHSVVSTEPYLNSRFLRKRRRRYYEEMKLLLVNEFGVLSPYNLQDSLKVLQERMRGRSPKRRLEMVLAYTICLLEDKTWLYDSNKYWNGGFFIKRLGMTWSEILKADDDSLCLDPATDQKNEILELLESFKEQLVEVDENIADFPYNLNI